MIWIIVAYSLINFVLQSLVQPKFLGDAVGLSFTLVSISLIVWAWVLGPLGAILAIPLSTLARALLLDLDPSKHWLNGLLSSAVEKPGRTRAADKTRESEPSPGQEPERGPPEERRPPTEP
jgi:AI-2 transport protein TqsA